MPARHAPLTKIGDDMNNNQSANLHPDLDKAIMWLEDATRDNPEKDKYGVVAMNILKSLRGDAPSPEQYEYRMFKIADCSCGCGMEIFKQRQHLFVKTLVEPILSPILLVRDGFINGRFSASDDILAKIERHMGFLFTGRIRINNGRYILTMTANKEVTQIVSDESDYWEEVQLSNGSIWDVHILVEGDRPEDVSVSVYPVVIVDEEGNVTDTFNPEPSNIDVVMGGV